MLNQKRNHNELTAKKIEWIFSVPLSLWMNGAVEVILKLTKHRLKAVTRDRIFKEESLSTYLTEVEAVLNNHPLTLISDDIKDLEPLTPNHFLIGRGNETLTLVSTHQMKLVSTFENSGSQYKPRIPCSGSDGYKNISLY